MTLKNYGVWTNCVFKIKQKNCGFGIKQKNDKIWINCGFDNQEGMSRKIIGLRQNGLNLYWFILEKGEKSWVWDKVHIWYQQNKFVYTK